jgi:hypothetical protein
MITEQEYKNALSIVEQWNKEEAKRQSIILKRIDKKVKDFFIGAAWNGDVILGAEATFPHTYGTNWGNILINITIEKNVLDLQESGVPSDYQKFINNLGIKYGKKINFPYWYWPK